VLIQKTIKEYSVYIISTELVFISVYIPHRLVPFPVGGFFYTKNNSIIFTKNMRLADFTYIYSYTQY